MVQTYGVARENNVDVDGNSGGADESRALLGSGGAEVAKPDGHATIGSCISNLSNTIMGTGAFFVASDRVVC